MAKAAVQSNPERWPPEGSSLIEAIERVSGTAMSALHAKTLFAGITHWPRPLTDEEKHNLKTARREAERALSMLLDKWNSGALSATGRRIDPLADAVPIPPPALTWRLRILDAARSVVVDPGTTNKCIFDLRFFLKELSTPKQPAKKRSWRGDAFRPYLVKRWPPDGTVPDEVTTRQAFAEITKDMKRDGLREPQIPSDDTFARAIGRGPRATRHRN